MAQALHRAIEDAIRDSSGYRARGILPVLVLEATRSLEADESLLYRAVYTIFRALPDRLVDGTTLNVATSDVPQGVALMWEAKERLDETAQAQQKPLRQVFGEGPHGDLVEIALQALQTFCEMRAGHVQTVRERVSSASSFDRPGYVVRRVEAMIPVRGQGEKRAPRERAKDEREGARA